MKLSILANAKINLFLDIKSKREDNYHNILSIMQSVDLCDVITIDYTPSEIKTITVECSDKTLSCSADNLIYKAALVFPCTGDIKVFLDKKIPVSAGLAGGSADAAAILVGLNKLTGEKLSLKDLKTIGGKLGADIPFCIEGGTCIVEGIGDIVKKIKPIGRCPIVVARIGEGMSTPEAYAMLDKKYDNFKDYHQKTDVLSELLQNIEAEKTAEQYKLFNIFEEVVEPIRVRVSELKAIMVSCGARKAIMSGSGTSVFGLFEDEAMALKAVDKLHQLDAMAFLCYPADRGVHIENCL